ncbi:MAG: ribonuclease III [Lachnospiraceae bacterium]|nr:ribonuclease III [Lachnospiraceae bacterium]
MEKSAAELAREFEQRFTLPQVDIRSYSPLTLAYMGDGIYELLIRTMLVKRGNLSVNKLHRQASSLVKASAQAAMAEALKEELTEEELAVYKRGRNAHSPTMAKHATMWEYRRATGFEALMGYLYLKQEWERMFYLVEQGLIKGELLCETNHKS